MTAWGYVAIAIVFGAGIIVGFTRGVYYERNRSRPHYVRPPVDKGGVN